MGELSRPDPAEAKFRNPALWRAAVKAMADLERLVWNDPLIQDDLTRAEGLRYLTRLISGALPMTLDMATPEHPQFFHFLSTRIHYGLPATDCLYNWAALHGDHVYRISGDRGSAHLFDIETRTGHFAHVKDWALFDRRSVFEVGPDNRVEIVLSRKRQPGNWIQLPEGPGNIIFRQYFYDWLNERPAQLRIVSEGAHYPPPALSTQQIAERTQLFIDWLNFLPDRFAQVVRTYYEAPANSMIFDGIDFGWKDLQYGKGTYNCAEDEALIVEVRLPKAPYWSIQLCSHFWEARDFHLRQTSLNGHQAQIDADGVFRAVISHADPGVPNWLDAGGHERGLLAIRYYRADSAPIPAMRKVKLSILQNELPVSTPRLSAEQRQQSLRERAASVPRRGCE
ncbi:DUF1214 domain-containing protein [Hydrocarboniphaga effusa]|uniref:DUF1214 domain-containing protein n=1 Tax=Hydrocarboniphaga effusa TaxID=243629 RepID=UPI003BA90D8A